MKTTARTAANASTDEEGTAQAAQRDQSESLRRPYFNGEYDPVRHRQVFDGGSIRSARGNSGRAFYVVNGGEEQEVAVVFVNDATSKARSVQAILANSTEAGLSMEIRGAVLRGLGVLGGYNTQAARARNVAPLREANAKLASLVENHGAIIDVSDGAKHSFLNSIRFPVTKVVAVIRDLNQANTANNTPHAGAHRVAEILEVAMRRMEAEGIIPDQGVKGVISVDRYAQQRQAAAAAGGAASEAAPAPAPQVPAAAAKVEDEPPF